MPTLVEELRNINQKLTSFVTKATKSEITEPLDAIKNSADKIGLAWSGSWLGYHANVYYKDFETTTARRPF